MAVRLINTQAYLHIEFPYNFTVGREKKISIYTKLEKNTIPRSIKIQHNKSWIYITYM